MKLKGRKFDNVDMIQAESKATLRNLSKSDFISCFDNWKKIWNRLTLTSRLGRLTLGFRVIAIDPCLVACDYLGFPFRIRSCHFQHVLTGCKPKQFLLINKNITECLNLGGYL
ncbi:hypothetical protein LAZ67_3004154, partial [Cordylochernes scorpioides]